MAAKVRPGSYTDTRGTGRFTLLVSTLVCFVLFHFFLHASSVWRAFSVLYLGYIFCHEPPSTIKPSFKAVKAVVQHGLIRTQHTTHNTQHEHVYIGRMTATSPPGNTKHIHPDEQHMVKTCRRQEKARLTCTASFWRRSPQPIAQVP